MIRNVKFGIFILALVILEIMLIRNGDIECGKLLGYLLLFVFLFFFMLFSTTHYIKEVFIKDMKSYKNIFILFVHLASISLIEWIIYLLSLEVYYCLK